MGVFQLKVLKCHFDNVVSAREGVSLNSPQTVRVTVIILRIVGA